MSMDGFIKLNGLDGEETRKGVEKNMAIFSFSWGVNNPVSPTGSGGMGAGKSDVSSFNFMKKSDSASPVLFGACANGTHYPDAVVALFKTGTDPVKFLEYKFENVIVSSVQWSGSTGGDDTPMESVSINFVKVEITYTGQDAKGKLAKPVSSKYDFYQRTS